VYDLLPLCKFRTFFFEIAVVRHRRSMRAQFTFPGDCQTLECAICELTYKLGNILTGPSIKVMFGGEN